ncbi:MAG TPA: tetratricopeptide repeat protein, partial [Terriglobales bacterium]|nr:tetratricopeptide repeat protein [Terriglobales bacterium]
MAFLLALVFGPFAPSSATQASKQRASTDVSSVQQAVKLAEGGRCGEAIPLLKKATLHIADKDLKRHAGFSGVRCAMIQNQADSAVEFLRFLNREFPHDPEVLYVSVHTYSDLSTRAAQQLATTAPNSPQAHELNAESLEVQGKWDLAQKEYQAVLQQNPRQTGIHFRLGRLLLSQPNPPPTAAEDAKKEFQQELEIDPSNAGAEYVLGELARQAQQLDEAIQHFSRAAKLDAGFGDAFLGLGSSLMSQKKFSEAVPPLETAVKLEPMNPGAHYNLAMAYARSGRKQEADKEFAIHREMMQKNGGAGAEQG